MIYQVKALKGKQIFFFDVHANHIDDAFSQIRQKGYLPIQAEAQKQGLKGIATRDKKFPLVQISQELLTLLQAGLNLIEGIETLSEKESRSEVKAVLDKLLVDLYQGKTLSAALENQPDIFPTLYMATVRASEKTGDLPESLARYIGYEQQLGAVQKKIITASIYPMLLIIVGGLVIFFLLGFVVPKFSRIYEDTGADLPWMSQMLMSWGGLIESHGKLILLALVAMIALVFYAFSMPKFRQACMQLLWKLPMVGEYLKIFQLARFYRTLGMLLDGGTPILSALDAVQGLLNQDFGQQLNQAKVQIGHGQPISVTFSQCQLTTPVAVRMLRVGERSGNIGEMMARISAFYDEDLTRWIEWFTRLFEPLLMLFIGLVIGLVVMLLYMPIFELAGSIQ